MTNKEYTDTIRCKLSDGLTTARRNFAATTHFCVPLSQQIYQVTDAFSQISLDGLENSILNHLYDY
jgi:hypothetical protein